MIYFISGHRDLTQEEFDKYYIPKISKILDSDYDAEFVIGDLEGCDKMALEFLLAQPIYDFITIYYVDNIRIKAFGEIPTNFENVYIIQRNTYDECDEAMTECSDFDIAWVRPGKEDSHTAMNIKRRYYGKV